MQQQLLTYRDSTVNYYRFGHGPKQVLCFHGYGEDAQSFAFLEGPMGNEYSFHAIDLPFHGQTIWKQGLDFTVNDLQQVLSPVSGQLKAANSKPVLLGFSLGGRVALSLYQSEPENIGKLVLLAPDGLLMNPWYWLSTQTMMGNRLFRFTMKHPGWFFGTLRGLNKIGQLNASISRFVNSYIGNPELRTLLYQRWTVLRKLRPDLSLIRSFIRKYETPVHLLYGKHDRIILPERGEKFRKGIEEYCTIDIVPAGHQVLQEKYIRQIKEALK